MKSDVFWQMPDEEQNNMVSMKMLLLLISHHIMIGNLANQLTDPELVS